MHSYTFCPVCKGPNISKLSDCPDHSVSKELFQLYKCADCTFLFTNPVPTEDQIGPYYKSEEYISHTDSNKGLINRLYHWVRNITLKQKVSLINLYAQGSKTLLDIGCGTGYFLKKAKENGWQVAGMEPDSDARSLACSNSGEKILSSISEIPHTNYSIITLWHVLEHIHQLDNSLKHIQNQQKKDNILIIALPNHQSWDAKHYKMHWAAYDVPRHLYHFNRKSVEKLLNQYQYQLIGIRPMWFDSIYVSMLSEKYRGGSTLAGIFKGFISNFYALFTKECSSHIYIFKKNS